MHKFLPEQAEKGGNLVTVNDYFGIVAAVTDVGICIAKVPELSEKAYESFQKRPPESASGVDLRITPIHQPVSHISFNRFIFPLDAETR